MLETLLVTPLGAMPITPRHLILMFVSGLIRMGPQKRQTPAALDQTIGTDWDKLKVEECRKCLKDGGQGRNRTADASLFRAALYQLSYLATERESLRDECCRTEIIPTGKALAPTHVERVMVQFEISCARA